jgi:uncharacterized protein (TIGR04255 family)
LKLSVVRLVKDDTNFGDQAPATEGLIDIRVGGTIALEDLERLSEDLSAEFPAEQPLIHWVGTFELRSSASVPQLDRGVRGFLRRDNENQAVVQLRRDGFTFSKLRPYTSWEDVSYKARALWQRYVDLAKPGQITRLAVRYINHIYPPEGWSQANEWLSIHATSPHIPGMPAQPADFHIRMLQRHPTAPHIATITVATVSDPHGQRALLFDIDVVHETAANIDDDTAWAVLADLRDFKNDIFFATITSKTRELLSNVANG